MPVHIEYREGASEEEIAEAYRKAHVEVTRNLAEGLEQYAQSLKGKGRQAQAAMKLAEEWAEGEREDLQSSQTDDERREDLWGGLNQKPIL